MPGMLSFGVQWGTLLTWTRGAGRAPHSVNPTPRRVTPTLGGSGIPK